MDVRGGPQRRLSAKELILSNCGAGEGSREFLGRNAMTNPDNIFKSRDITLPTKVHIVIAVVFQ